MKIFGEIIEDAKKETRNNDWFRDQLFSRLETVDLTEESPDDDTRETNGIEGGELYFFAYSAKFPNRYPFYDRFPLVYILNTYKDGFLGCNLHYIEPNDRRTFAKSLINKGTGIIIPNKTLHKYLFEQIVSDINRVPVDEYEGVSILPTEKFVNPLGITIPSRKVWRS